MPVTMRYGILIILTNNKQLNALYNRYDKAHEAYCNVKNDPLYGDVKELTMMRLEDKENFQVVAACGNNPRYEEYEVVYGGP